MKKLNKKDFLFLLGDNFAFTFEQSKPNYSKGNYKVLATAYEVNSLGAREPKFYAIYTDKI